MRSARLLVPLLLASVLLTGCFTGKRAHFASATATTLPPVPDAAVQAVIAKLESPDTGQFTANYGIIVKYGNTTTTATIAQMAPTNISITVGHVRFLTNDDGQTCELTTGVCVPGLQDQQISDTQLPHNFYSASAALKLRQDATTMVNAATGSSRQIAGQTATCVEVHFAAGNKTYCALDDGLLAEQDTPDVRIDLTSYNTGVDTSLFSAPIPGATSTTVVTTAATIPFAGATTAGG
jgi:hypothetical protein